MILQVGVKALIKNREGEYLFLRRTTKLATDSNDTSWDIPGGRINPEESTLDGLKREIKEETGHTISSIPRLIAAQDIFVEPKNMHVVRLTYIIEEDVPEVQLSSEHDAHQWVGTANLDSVNAEPYLASVLRKL